MRIQITIPANTPIASPLITRVQFTEGTIVTRQRIMAPYGHLFLTGIQIRYGNLNSLVIPTGGSNTDWLVLGGNQDKTYERLNPIVFDPPKYQIEVRAYNLDDTYPHTFYIDMEA